MVYESSVRPADFYNLDESAWNRHITEVFSGAVWFEPFMESSHHGIGHGHTVRYLALDLTLSLTDDEKEEVYREGRDIEEGDPFRNATVAVEISGIFHDCGRFNDAGEVIREEQNDHPIRSAARALKFCRTLGLPGSILPYVSDAVLNHDYQSREITPIYSPPRTLIGKIVQSADQLAWFDPMSVQRTIEAGKEFGELFFDQDITIEQRLEWGRHADYTDCVCILMTQLFGPTGHDRFGVHQARVMVDSFRDDLKRRIIEASAELGFGDEVSRLIAQYESHITM